MTDWISVKEGLPVLKNGDLSKPMLICSQEFGCQQKLAVANCWISSSFPLFPKWYLCREFYNIPELFEISAVTHYMPIEFPDESE